MKSLRFVTERSSSPAIVLAFSRSHSSDCYRRTIPNNGYTIEIWTFGLGSHRTVNRMYVEGYLNAKFVDRKMTQIFSTESTIAVIGVSAHVLVAPCSPRNENSVLQFRKPICPSVFQELAPKCCKFVASTPPMSASKSGQTHAWMDCPRSANTGNSLRSRRSS